MMRKVVSIDSEKCTGCGACAEACVEGAIKMINGKAVLVSEAYCDGLGACLPTCPADAISIVEKETVGFEKPKQVPVHRSAPVGGIPMTCPGSGARRIVRKDAEGPVGEAPGRLSQWPVQLRLVPTGAPFFDGCDLLVAADCCAYAHGSFHERFIKGRTVVIGCPKLDPQDCWTKLTDIIAMHDIRSVTVTRMEVPCCSGIVNAALSAVEKSGKDVPVKVYTVHPDGTVTE